MDRVEELLNVYESEAKETVPSIRLNAFIQKEIKNGFLEGAAREALGVRVEFFRETVECIGRNTFKGTVVIGTCLAYAELDNSNRESVVQVTVFEDTDGFAVSRGYAFTVLSTEDK